MEDEGESRFWVIVWRSSSRVSGLSKFRALSLLLLLLSPWSLSLSVRTDMGGDERDDGGEAMVDVQCQETTFTGISPLHSAHLESIGPLS